ncbi:hypothetical protein MWN33_17170 [Starkeya koreensis]|uniref:Uncharacterized protein n=1 Tax=Ancylobacter koreensis TaxID=266121 RepID=A0ABT0DR61_9HYPH|nr:hypothetical protein [Ancylobacter koreensis]MCK0209768.1 hypothetical protein [Ancylobacter koreensis]
MIPDFVSVGASAPWPVLPPGIHDATLEEVAARFATTPHRAWLFGGFVRAVEALRFAGCSTIFLDGSFITAKPHPGDFDGLWDLDGVDPYALDPVLLDFDNMRAAQKAKYFGEMFLTQLPHQPGLLPFFQKEKFSDAPKGIVRISPRPAHGATI